MIALEEEKRTGQRPTHTVDISAVLSHCQNAAYAAAKLARENAASSQVHYESTREHLEHELTSTNAVAFAGGLKARIGEFVRHKCGGLSVLLSESEANHGDVCLTPSALLDVHELPLQVQVPDHLRRVASCETQVLVDVVFDSTASLRNDGAGLFIVMAVTIAGRSIAGVLCSAMPELPIVAVLDGGIQNMPVEHTTSTVTANERVSVLISKLSEEGFDALRILECVGPCKTPESPPNVVHQCMAIAKGQAHLLMLARPKFTFTLAAMEVIIMASGGDVTDVFGNKLQYDASGTRSGFGFVASSKSFGEVRGKKAHMRLCQSWREAMVFDHLLEDRGLLMSGEPQATDIALDTLGRAMTVGWLSQILNIQVLGFEARESTAVRYLMSNACRLSLRCRLENGTEERRNLFVKRVAMDELEHVRYKMKTAPHKLIRDVRSYEVEAGFLNTAACKRFATDRTRIVNAHYIESKAAARDVPAMLSRFLFVLEDFGREDGWYQRGLLNYEESVAALDALASFHAFFWNAREMDGYEELKRNVWSQATYWLPSRQASDCFEKLAQYWNEHRQRFQGMLDDVATVSDVIDAENFGQVLERHAMGSAEIVHGFGLHEEHGERTLIHGDPKAANMFFRKAQASREKHGDLEVALIDFQWCGWGHGGVDVAYVLACGVHADVLAADGADARLLREYYERFVRYLVRFGKARDDGDARARQRFANLKRVYEEALVDLARVVVGYHWVRIGASERQLAQRAAQLGVNSYNKSARCAQWLMARCARVLSDKCRREGTVVAGC
eukprot:TRINITY_DN563_c0_g1_i2.p1 TRINITY_DN563_c0_g1~~TRINITY_DN563_c0_g1_i2.p1  ORF type:complete len:789 (-),score=146.74 TRINITY_DN563_c0_g1_i2:10988-13354(-)